MPLVARVRRYPGPTLNPTAPFQTTLATSVGVVAKPGSGTELTMVRADLTQPGRVDITQFELTRLDGGEYT